MDYLCGGFLLSGQKVEAALQLNAFGGVLVVRAEAGRMSIDGVAALLGLHLHGVDTLSVGIQVISQQHL